jgi:Peptidase family S41
MMFVTGAIVIERRKGMERVESAVVPRIVALFGCALIAAACSRSGPSPAMPTAVAGTTATEYLQQIVSIMEANSVNRLRIDWADFKAQVLQRANGALTIEATYPAISLALGLLNDHHSFFQTATGGAVANPNALRCTALVPAAPVSQLLPTEIGYVRVSQFSDPQPAVAIVFADGIQRQIRDADRADLVGWIVDVRFNGGGNMWPMVAGVGPVLGEGLVGSFVPPTGRPNFWTFANGRSSLDGVALGQTSSTYSLLESAPRVAVLTDAAVASSGEAVVVAFRGRPNTRSFGGSTCGLSTANQTFALSDGATLVLTVSTMADRTGVAYGGVVVPDEQIGGDAAVVQRAVQWLREGRPAT